MAGAQWHALSVRTNVFVAERREPPGEYPSDLPTVTGQLALFRYKVSAIWLAPFRYQMLAAGREPSGDDPIIS